MSLGNGMVVFTNPLLPQSLSLSLSLLYAKQDVEFSVPIPMPCMTVCDYTCHDDDQLNLWNWKQASITCFLLKEFTWLWCLFIITEHLQRQTKLFADSISKILIPTFSDLLKVRGISYATRKKKHPNEEHINILNLKYNRYWGEHKWIIK